MLVRKFSFKFAVAFFVLLTLNLARADSSDATNTIKWGEVCGGFQLGIELEETAGAVHCWLRNATTSELEVNTCALGRWDSVRLLVQSDNGMRPLARTASDFIRGVEGIGPSAYPNTNFGANLIVPPIAGGYDLGRRRFGDPVRSTNSISWKLRPEIPSPLRNHSTFMVDLLDFDWPKDCFTNQFVNVQIIETLYREQSASWGLVYSRTGFDRKFDNVEVRSILFCLNSQMLASLFAKLPPDKPEDGEKMRRDLEMIPSTKK